MLVDSPRCKVNLHCRGQASVFRLPPPQRCRSNKATTEQGEGRGFRDGRGLELIEVDPYCVVVILIGVARRATTTSGTSKWKSKASTTARVLKPCGQLRLGILPLKRRRTVLFCGGERHGGR